MKISPPSRKLRRHLLAVIVLGLILAAGVAIWWNTRPPADADATAAKTDAPGGMGRGGGNRTQPVSVAEVKQATMPQWLQAIGTVIARNQVIVRSRVDGELIRIAFKEGQLVKSGDLLAEIDPRPFQVQLAQISGQLARDQALLQNAELDLKRYRDLWAKDSIAKQQLDTQEALVRQYQGTVEAGKGAVENARLQLGYARVVAPISGRIGLRNVDPGNLVRASDANGLASIAQLQPITVVFAVPEHHIPSINKRLTAGETLKVEAWDREQKNLLATGQLLTTDNQIDATTGTIKLKAEFANKEGVLFPNQFVNARLLLGTLENATVVPVAAVQRGARGNFVYAVDAESTVRIVGVFPGASDGKVIAVGGDLQPGDRVVTDGTDRLRPGAKVEIITAEARAAAMAPPGGRGERGGKTDATPAAPSTPTTAGTEPGKPPAVSPTAASVSTPVLAAPATPGSKAGLKPEAAAPAAKGATAGTNPWGEGEKPRWWDRVPPEIQEMLMKMSPEDRREWLIKRREERERAAAAAAGG
ncbi:MAG TPA: MdtA/MuxA family multidrug efflux RND transporter periplasmic adaptor subunit [Rhodocyclaceae bacterium]|nr:MdtA/MuxA family multidrug efflux RND transporter periplasmic adaptor subunit [Rhodocyclaceae bacterium]